MDKKIEDYLHLYLGCQFVLKIKDTDNYSAPMTFGVDALAAASFPQNSDFRITPILILRPLSDMTEEEAREGWRYVKSPHYSGVTNYQYALTHLNLSLNVQQHAEIIKWMLSKNFDLFGLIDAGLAISKVEVSNPLKTE